MKKIIGNLLMIGSFLILLGIYYPVILAYWGPSSYQPVPAKGSFIQIPKIKAFAKIVENVDPWDRKIYEKALMEGVAQAKGMENFFFAHSSLPPWKMTRTNTAFLRLGELKKGDQIIIYKNGKDYIYQVEDKKEVWPNEVGYLVDRSRDYLVLQTCTPLGTDLKRLLVFAKQIR